jgi:hypothetical protein
MGKLPGNIVKVPPFENPLRPTTPAPAKVLSLTADDSTPNTAQPADSGSKPLQLPPVEAARDEAFVHRVYARFSDEQWRALETERHHRSMRGEKVTVADLLREIVDYWRGRAA